MKLSDLSLGAVLLSTLAVAFLVTTLITVAATVWADPNPTKPKVKGETSRTSADLPCPQCEGGCPVPRSLTEEYALAYIEGSGAPSGVFPDGSRYICYSLQPSNGTVEVAVYDRSGGNLFDPDGRYDGAAGTFTFPTLTQYNATVDRNTGIVTVTGGGQIAPTGDPDPVPPNIPRIAENFISSQMFGGWQENSDGDLPGDPGAILDPNPRYNSACLRVYADAPTRQIPFLAFGNDPAGDEFPIGGYIDLDTGRFLCFDRSVDDVVAGTGKLYANKGAWYGDGNDSGDQGQGFVLALHPATLTGRYSRKKNTQTYTNVGFNYSSLARFMHEVAEWDDFNFGPP